MGSEYIRISGGEGLFAQMNFLEAQLELLNSVKKLREYKKLRNNSALLKIELKNKVEEIKELLAKLKKLLPRSEYLIQREERPQKLFKKRDDLSLEDEIDLIEAKLRALQGGDSWD